MVSNSVLVFGASGSIGLEVIKILASQNYQIYAYSTSTRPKIKYKNVKWNRVKSYDELGSIPNFKFALVCNGYFEPSNLKHSNFESIYRTVEINLRIPVSIVFQLVRSIESDQSIKNIMIIGSTSAYSGFPGTSVYCASKHGLVGFIRSLNKEYSESNVRFCLFSMGTVENSMGAKVLTSGTLLSPEKIAMAIFNRLVETTEAFEPEVLVRRRNSK